LVFRLTISFWYKIFAARHNRAKDSTAKLDIDAFLSNFSPTTMIRQSPKILRFYYFAMLQYVELPIITD